MGRRQQSPYTVGVFFLFLFVTEGTERRYGGCFFVGILRFCSAIMVCAWDLACVRQTHKCFLRAFVDLMRFGLYVRRVAPTGPNYGVVLYDWPWRIRR